MSENARRSIQDLFDAAFEQTRAQREAMAQGYDEACKAANRLRHADERSWTILMDYLDGLTGRPPNPSENVGGLNYRNGQRALLQSIEVMSLDNQEPPPKRKGWLDFLRREAC